ncbi:maltase-glucoamylase, intestinal-like isoform X2 [Portunus trituberculatus]|uniref:maltase-glucoamylase, intestinal-like isoform X2 n=1 Tax=Portunus trituberculatus TaxID=210409 RepID=UPI001E1D027A|nr:maltase-glucoamylase, intestinal-like isoform X2 [Portunus trituberculatus]
MFKKVETGTVVITHVEDSDEGDGVPGGTVSSATHTAGEPSQGQVSEGKNEDKQELVGRSRGTSCKYVMMYNKHVILGYLMLFCIFLGLILPYILASFAFPATEYNQRGSCFLNISYRFDCLPGASRPTRDECLGLGCCYSSNSKDLYAPTCFHSIPSEYGYRVTNVTASRGVVVNDAASRDGPKVKGRKMYRLGKAGDITLNLGPIKDKTNFGTEAWSLSARVQRGGSDVVRVLVYSPEHDDFLKDDFAAEPAASYQLDVVVTQDLDGDFNITVTRLATGEVVLETIFGPMIYGRDFAELTTRIPTQQLYGLGLRRNFDFEPNYKYRARWPLFTRETTYEVDNTTVASGNSGAHPFYMNFERTPGYMYGLYLRTSAPVEVGVLPIPAVVFRGVGTLWDLRIMAGPTPRDVTRQYTSMVGRPAMPPYWALGYHLCRSGPAPNDFSVYDGVVKGMNETQLPYESDCIDASLSQSFAPLTTEAQERVTALQKEGRKFMLVQYPYVSHSSAAYSDSEQFLLKHNDSSDYYGKVEGQAVGYPDYVNENALPLWLNHSTQVRELYANADGVMLLNNTPLNQAELNYTLWNASEVMCTPDTPGACCPDPALPFLPSGVEDVNNHSLCVSLVHPSLGNTPHLHLHNAYGYFHHRRIKGLMKEIAPKKRPFVTSQSTHPGSGAEGGAFGESFGGNFMEQKVSLVQVLELGLYGVPLAGVPICGSRNDTKGELKSEWCLRGHQMAAFWPLMVSHYEHGHEARNPTDFDKAFAYHLAVFIRMRYVLLPYFYTLLYEASLEGIPMARPLFYEFPEDEASRAVSTQFMVGSGLLVSPVLNSVGVQDSIDATLYFPPGRWYNFFSGATVADSVNGTDIVIPTLLADVNVYVKGGAIIPLQGNLHHKGQCSWTTVRHHTRSGWT